MGFVDRLPGKKEEEKIEREESLPLPEGEFESMIPPVHVAADGHVEAPIHEAVTAAPSDAIRAFDQNGREVMVPRAEWRENVLPGMIREVWDSPEQLYVLIANSLNDGFLIEVADAAEQLYAIDTIPARGVCMWAVILIQTERLNEAEKILNQYLAQYGDEGSVLMQLARVDSVRGDAERAEATLWRAIEAEPNLDNGLGWYLALQQEKGGGEAAATEALQRIAAMPGSWRAQLWMAREAILANDMPGAMTLYRDALDRAPKPAPGDLLMQMSGDLGGNGHLAELVELTAPNFIPEAHGLPVGNNLIKATLDLGNTDAAAEIVRALAAFGRPDWREPLGFWEQEIARIRGASGASAPGQIQVGMLRIDGPIWLPAGSPGRSLFGEKATGGPSVTFLGGTAETTAKDPQALDAAGRMSRALPLFFAEQVDMRTNASGRAMLPWAMGQQSGFVVGSVPWTEEMAVQTVSADGNRSDYVVSTHVDATVDPWTAELIFVRASDGVKIGELDAEFPAANPTDGIPGLAEEVIELLGGEFRAQGYTVPESFSGYLARLEQLLAVRCAGMDGVPASFLQGASEILDGNLSEYMAEPENLASRLLLVETFGAVERVRPETAAEYRERMEKLFVERPLTAG